MCRALSDCVHEQVAKRIVNVRFTVVKETMPLLCNSSTKAVHKAIVKYLKGITGGKTVRTFSGNKKPAMEGRRLWNHSYYVETIGSVSEENIRRYMEHQSKSYSFKADCKYRSALLSEGRRGCCCHTEHL